MGRILFAFYGRGERNELISTMDVLISTCNVVVKMHCCSIFNSVYFIFSGRYHRFVDVNLKSVWKNKE